MAVGTAYVLHGIVNSSTFLSQITNARAVPDVQVMLAEASGLPFPLFVSNSGQNPAVPFDTTQVKTVLDLTGAMSSIADLSAANTDLLFKKLDDLDRRIADATAEHIRCRMSQAFLVLDQISAGHNSDAVASCRLGTTYDGSNAPLVAAGSVALSGTPTSAEHFRAGPVSINTVALGGVQDVTIAFNRQVIEVGGDGELYNTFAACGYYSPVVTIRTLTSALPTYGLNGTALTALSVYLRKRTTTGNVADGTAQHIKFSATSGLISIDEQSGGGNQPSITTIRCSLVGANATTEPISVDTASTIT